MTTKEEVVERYSGYVRAIATRVRKEFGITANQDDLVADGMHGLLEAHTRFDPQKGVLFTTFAHYRIRGAILDGIRRSSYMSRRAHQLVKAAEGADMILEELPEVSSESAVGAAATLSDTLNKLSASFVLSCLGQNEDDHRDNAADLFEQAETKERLLRAIESLPEREKLVIKKFYFEEMPLDDVGALLGLSKSWTSRIHTHGVSLLRDALMKG